MFWSGRTDLNRRQLPWQGSALPLSYGRIILDRKDTGRALFCQFLYNFFYSLSSKGATPSISKNAKARCLI
jgi:hypothetical protein